MNHSILQTVGLAPDALGVGAEHAGVMRATHRAMGELRRGVPVLVAGDDAARGGALVVLAAETADAASLAEFFAASQGGGVLLLAAGRAEAVLGQAGRSIVAITPPAEGWTIERLRQLASPSDAAMAGPRALEAAGLAAVQRSAEAAIALAKLAGLLPAMLVACPGPAFAECDFLRVGADQVTAYPRAANAGLARSAEAVVPLADAPDSRVVAFRPADGGPEHLAVLIGRPENAEAPLVRLHSACLTGDVLGSLRCDCGPQLQAAMARMAAEGAGVVLYMAHEGRGIGLVNKLRAYRLQDEGLDTLDANRALGFGPDERSFDPAAVMLKALGVTKIRLLTNNPAKVAGLEACGIEVTGRLRHAIAANGVNDSYLDTKARRFGHVFD